MILYLSNATACTIYSKLFNNGDIVLGGAQVQKFNSNIIEGLSNYDDIVAISTLAYNKKSAPRIEELQGNVRYICIKNVAGFFHKIANLIGLYKESAKAIKRNRPAYIICDAISISPRIVSLLLSYRYKIPVVGIITDIPGMLRHELKLNQLTTKTMQYFDGYIILTKYMNKVVNPSIKPFLVIEGLCPSHIPELMLKSEKKIFMYTGALWEHDAGIEYLVEGFIKANLKDTELHLYGTGLLENWLHKISSQHSEIKYLGYISNNEIEKKQAEATLLINPRHSDEEFCYYSFPSKTIEYMLSGTPVLMTRLPSVPDEYFEYVFSIEQETSNGIVKILQEIAKMPNEELISVGHNAREFVINNKACTVQSEKIYRFLKDTNY